MDCTVIFCVCMVAFSFTVFKRQRRLHKSTEIASEFAPKSFSPRSALLLYVSDLTSSSTVTGMALAWQQMSAILIKRFHHSRRDWKGLISQILLPVLFVVFAMSLGSIKSDVQHYPELQLSPALYKIGPSYSFFRSVPAEVKIQINHKKRQNRS